MCYIVEKNGKRVKYLTTQEAAEILGLRTRAWMHRLVSQGHIEPAATLHLHPKVKDFLLFKPSDIQALKALREKYPPVNGAKWVYPKSEYKQMKEWAADNPEAISPEIQAHLAYGQIVPSGAVEEESVAAA